MAILIALGTSCKSKIPEKKSEANTFTSQPEVDLTLFFKAEEEFLNAKFNQSRETYRLLSLQFPDSSGIWARIATCYAKQSNYSQALLTLDTALRLEPNNYNYLDLQAYWLSKNSRPQQAAEAFLKLSSKNLKSWTLIEDAARNSYRTRNYKKLIEICDTWSRRFGLNDRVAYYYLHAYDRQNDSGSILRLLDKLETKYPDRIRYGKKRLIYLTKKGYYHQAHALGNKVYKSLPSDNNVVYSYLQACYLAEDWPMANEVLRDIASNTALKTRTVKNSFSLVTKKKERFEEFDTLVEEANRHHAGKSTWDLYYSHIRSEAGDYSLTIKSLKSAVKEHPSNIKQWEKLLQMLYFVKDLELVDYVVEFREMYPFMNIGKLYGKAAGLDPAIISNNLKDENLSAISAYDLWKKENKASEAFELMKEECSQTRNPIILSWMYELAKELKKPKETEKYLKSAKENGAIIE